ncbi:MAG: hypothetical protein ABEJ05_08745 [Haloglomus sp.]
MRRSLSAVVLAALVLLSGCSLLGGGTTPTGAPTPTPIPTPTPTSTSAATPTPTPAPADAFPAGYGETGVMDPETALSTHADSLVNHRSFVVDINGSVATGSGARVLRRLQSVDVDDGRALIAVNGTSSVRRTTYFADGKRYRRVDPPGADNVRYEVTDASLEPRAFTGIGFLTPVLTNLTYGSANVTETANGTFYAYSATGVDRSVLSRLLGPSIDPDNVTRFDAGVVVDEEGIVRQMSYRAVIERDGQRLVVSVELQTYAIDGVDISPPPWLDEARQADTGS